MKKTILTVICFVMAALSITASAAGLDTNKQKVLDALTSSFTVDGKVVSLPSDVLTQAENYLKRDDVTITKNQADLIVTEVEDAISIVKDSGAASIAALDARDKSAILENIQNAAEVIDLTVSVDSAKSVITILDDKGNPVASDEGVIKVTGPDSSALAVIAGAGLALIAGCFVAARKMRLFSK